MADAVIVHKPGPGGLFAQEASCGASAKPDGASLVLHEWAYNCPLCMFIAGEGGFVSSPNGGPPYEGT